jgi:hypothetical protein
MVRFRSKPDPFTTSVVTEPATPLWYASEQLEYDIFVEEAYIAPNKHKRITSFDAYQKNEFIIAVEGGTVIGVIRLVLCDDRKMAKKAFPTLANARVLNYRLSDARKNPELKPPFEDDKTLWLYKDSFEQVLQLDPSKCHDLATMSILRSKRNGIVSSGLIRATLVHSLQMAKPISLSCIDTPFFEKLVLRGYPYEQLGPSVKYWGSPTTPCMVSGYHILKRFQKLIIPYLRIKYLLNTMLKK